MLLYFDFPRGVGNIVIIVTIVTRSRQQHLWGFATGQEAWLRPMRIRVMAPVCAATPSTSKIRGATFTLFRDKDDRSFMNAKQVYGFWAMCDNFPRR